MEDFDKIENTESEVTVNEPEEVLTNPDENESSTPVVDNDTDDSADELSVPVEEKTKKKIIQTPLLIAACILLVAIIAAVVYFFFFNNSIVGTWAFSESTSTADEASSKSTSNKTYYTFEGDGTLTVSIGTMEVKGTWENTKDDSDTPDESKKFVSFSTAGGTPQVYEYNIEGNIFTGKTLVLKPQQSLIVQGAPTSFKLPAATVTVPEVKVSKDFKAVKSVTGSWNTKDSYGNTNTYTFNNDGTFKYTVSGTGNMTMTGTYKVNESKKTITITYVRETEISNDIPYEPGKKSTELTIAGTKLTKAK